MNDPILHTTSVHTPNDLEHMPAGKFNRLVGKVLHRLTRYYQKSFRNRNYIFVHQGPFEPVKNPICEFARYKSFDEVPRDVREAIERYGGQKALETDRREMEQDSIMWVAFLGQQLTGVLFTRRGVDFQRWFVKLQDDDIVIFRVRTYPEFRGRGIAPSLMRYAMNSLLHKGNNAYIDCRVYNRPSIRCIENAGFSMIATMKPMLREEAVK